MATFVLTLRVAAPADIPSLELLIPASVRGLQAKEYSPEQLQSAIDGVYGVDTQLVSDGTYFVVEADGALVGGGGWSKRKTLYGGDRYVKREDALLDPASDAAKIRAFFVHPRWARRGVGTMILEACERAATAAGFTRFEMGATLTGVPFYAARGYEAKENLEVPLDAAPPLGIVRMEKRVDDALTHRSRLAGFIIDCENADLDRATAFWSAALGMKPKGREGEYDLLDAAERDLHIEVQRVSHPSRLHLDIESDDVEAEVARLEALGAKRHSQVRTWVVMEAPTGQRFCVVRAKKSLEGAPGAHAWARPRR